MRASTSACFAGYERDLLAVQFVLLESSIFQQSVELNSLRSATREYRSWRQFEHCSVEVPSHVDEQTAIAAVLSDMDAEIAALEQRLAKTRALKQGMMQELLTGRVGWI